MPADNRIEWDANGSGANLRISGVLSLRAGNNNQIGVFLKIFNDIGTEIESFAFPSITTNGTGRAENITISQFADIKKDYYLEIWVENQTNSGNITMEVNSIVLVEQRNAV